MDSARFGAECKARRSSYEIHLINASKKGIHGQHQSWERSGIRKSVPVQVALSPRHTLPCLSRVLFPSWTNPAFSGGPFRSKGNRVKGMARAYQTLSLFELCAGAEPFSAAEVAAVLAPMLGHLAVQHAQDAGGAGHGNLSLASVAIHVSEDHDGTVHLPPPLLTASAATHVRCVSCMAPEDTVSGQSTQAADIWSVGVIAVQMLLGRQCAFAQCGGHCRGLVHRGTGELPVMPKGMSFECYDFLMDCLSPLASERPSASRLLDHPYIQAIADGSSAYPTAIDHNMDALLPVLHQLLICEDIKTQRAPCRPVFVPILVAPIWETHFCFETPSHTTRCNCHSRPYLDESASSHAEVKEHTAANNSCAGLNIQTAAAPSKGTISTSSHLPCRTSPRCAALRTGSCSTNGREHVEGESSTLLLQGENSTPRTSSPNSASDAALPTTHTGCHSKVTISRTSSALPTKRKVCHSRTTSLRAPSPDSESVLTEIMYIPEDTLTMQCHKKQCDRLRLPTASVRTDMVSPILVVPIFVNVVHVC